MTNGLRTPFGIIPIRVLREMLEPLRERENRIRELENEVKRLNDYIIRMNSWGYLISNIGKREARRPESPKYAVIITKAHYDLIWGNLSMGSLRLTPKM